MAKPTPAQAYILDQMRRGYVLSSSLDTKYRFLDMPAEHGGCLLNPAQSTIKAVLLSTIKAMLNKGLIVEEKRFSSSGFCDGHVTETWAIYYKLNLCISCYERPSSNKFNDMFCEDCAKKMGDQWEAEWNKHVQEATARHIQHFFVSSPNGRLASMACLSSTHTAIVPTTPFRNLSILRMM